MQQPGQYCHKGGDGLGGDDGGKVRMQQPGRYCNKGGGMVSEAMMAVRSGCSSRAGTATRGGTVSAGTAVSGGEAGVQAPAVLNKLQSREDETSTPMDQ